MTIRLLPEHIINQIAAGEVIENPASVVKELVENALDAKATHIAVEIKEGGQQLIRVSDNGMGMSREDALACLQRHATSKIEKVEDLFHLSTMGFRGEALSSIASISQLTLTTCLGLSNNKMEEGIAGTRVMVEAGTPSVEPCARSKGTTIDVLSLFYNVPARKKFQKKPSVNAAEVTRALIAISLAHPEVAFELIQQERVSFSTPAFGAISFENGLAQRIREVLGDEFVSLKVDHPGIRGFVGAPQFSRPNRTGQYLFINRRPVFSQAISFAVKDAFGTTIEAQRHPIFVLHLTIPPEEIDVNVHPQKKEVRLSNEQKIREKVMEAVRQSLYQTQPQTVAQIDQLPLAPSAHSFALPRFSPAVFDAHAFAQRDELSNYSPSLQEPQLIHSTAEEPIEELIAKQRFDSTHVHVIGIFASYLLIEASSVAKRLSLKQSEKSDAMLLVNLHAASQRVVFELLVKGKKKEMIQQQMLLFPLVLEFSLPDMEKLLPHLDAIEEIGFSLRPAGPRALFVDALPSFIRESEVQDLLLEIAEELFSSLFSSLEQEQSASLVHHVVARFAKAEKKHFMVQEALELFEALLKTASPYQNLDGKPTMVYVSSHEIESLFTKKNLPSTP